MNVLVFKWNENEKKKHTNNHVLTYTAMEICHLSLLTMRWSQRQPTRRTPVSTNSILISLSLAHGGPHDGLVLLASATQFLPELILDA